MWFAVLSVAGLAVVAAGAANAVRAAAISVLRSIMGATVAPHPMNGKARSV